MQYLPAASAKVAVKSLVPINITCVDTVPKNMEGMWKYYSRIFGGKHARSPARNAKRVAREVGFAARWIRFAVAHANLEVRCCKDDKTASRGPWRRVYGTCPHTDHRRDTRARHVSDHFALGGEWSRLRG